MLHASGLLSVLATATAIRHFNLLDEVDEFQLLVDGVLLLGEIFIFVACVRVSFEYLEHLLDYYLYVNDLQLFDVEALQDVIQCAYVV